MENAITFSWFNDEKSILLCTYPNNPWTWDDFFEALETQYQMIDSVDHALVHIIVDTRESHWLARGGNMLTNLRKLSNRTHPRQGYTIIVGAKGAIAALAKFGSQLAGDQHKMQLVDSMEDAEAILAQV